MDKKKLLFTPGPLSTSETVKQSMMRDVGSRDTEYLEVVRAIRRRLLELGNVADGNYEGVLMQGSGTFAVQSVISSILPRSGLIEQPKYPIDVGELLGDSLPGFAGSCHEQTLGC